MSHRCPWPGCTEEVSSTRWGCRAHWYALPNNLRAWIGRAYRIGVINGTHPTPSWKRAHETALAYAADQSKRVGNTGCELAVGNSENANIFDK